MCCLAGRAQQWTQLADFPGLARDDAAAFVIGTDIYVGTGMDVGFQNTSDWYRFNTQDNTWAAIASLPATGRQYASAFAFNGIGYLLGGNVQGMTSAEVFHYDPVQDTWAAAPPLPDAVYASTTFMIGDRGYLCSGVLGSGLPSTLLWIHDPSTGTWSSGAAIDSLPMSRAASFAHEGKGYVVGGTPVINDALAGAWQYDPASDSWTTVAPLPAPRNAADAVGVADGGVVIGGQTPIPNAAYGNVWHYTAASDTWQDLPAFPPATGRRGAVIAYVPPGSIYYGTGSDNVQRYSDWWRFDMPVGVPEVGAGGVTIHPVPARDQLHVELQEGSIASPFQVVDVQGRELMRLRGGSSRYTVDVSGLAPGTYIIRALTGRQWQRRFMVVP
jgi:hypothetical protein